MPAIIRECDRRKLATQIKDLLLLKSEDEYWDFKEEWYSSDKKTEMLHDIICMANNMTGKDGLLIFGVRDSDKEVVGVELDENRRTTQNVVDFLRDKSFHGDYRPQIQVVSIELDNHTLDILIVFSVL